MSWSILAGLILGADLYVIDVEVGDGAKLLLTTQSATKIYRTPGSFAEQRMTLRLGEGAQLELAPDQLIAYREASYRQNTHITLTPSSSLVMAEVITPGWSPDGASFRYEELRLRTEIHVEAGGGTELLALDNLLIRPSLNDVTGMGFMEGRSHLGSLVVVDSACGPGARRRTPCALGRARRLYRGIPHRVTRWNHRAWCCGPCPIHTEELNRLLGACTALLRGQWYGQAPLDLRKY